MAFQDVVFLSSRAIVTTTFLIDCGRVECLRKTCVRNVVGCKQGHAPCQILLL